MELEGQIVTVVSSEAEDWLDDIFRPCPSCIRKIFQEEAIDNQRIFSGLQEDELKELCAKMKIGHRVLTREAFYKVKRWSPQSEHVFPVPTKVHSIEPNMIRQVKKRPINHMRERRSKHTYVFTVGVKRKIKDYNWVRDSKYPMSKLNVLADYTYDDLLKLFQQHHGIESDYTCVLLDSNNEVITREEFGVERYIRNKRYIGSTRIYLGISQPKNVAMVAQSNGMSMQLQQTASLTDNTC